MGILDAKRYFRLSDKSRESVMQHAVTPPWFIPETVRADVLFKQMQHSRNHFAVVLDEYGGLAGVVSLEDVLEEILGSEIMDESDNVADLRALARDRRKALTRKAPQDKPAAPTAPTR